MDARRDQIIDIINREFIGPDPISALGMIQDNGEEILSSDPPRVRYIAGVLFPQQVKLEDNTQDTEPEEIEPDQVDDIGDAPEKGSGTREVLQDAEELLNLSNSYQQSAISLTAAIRPSDAITVSVSAGMYIAVKEHDPEAGKEHVKYLRNPIKWSNDRNSLELPESGTKKYDVTNSGHDTDLCFAITYRYAKNGLRLYTFTLENTNIAENGKIRDEDCYFQVGFSLNSRDSFAPLPENEKLNYNDNDYLSNQMMYRNVRSYAIGHGCAVSWDDQVDQDKGAAYVIETSIFPQYEIKPIVPSAIKGVSLEMYRLSDRGEKDDIITELDNLCNNYEEWITKLIDEKLPEVTDKGTALRHIEACKECLSRMRDGVNLLKGDDKVLLAF